MNLEFWYEFASTYSYLSAMRVEAAAAKAGVEVTWRPFLLGPIFAAQGWQDSPFNLYPTKGRYMWKDVARRARAYGLSFRKPTLFPQNGLLAARVALVGASQEWCPEFTRAVYRAEFADGRDISDRGLLAAILSSLSVDAEAVLEGAQDDANKSALRAQTEKAQRLGIFGAPSFWVDEELFWGDDRLEDALAAGTARRA